MGLDIRGLSISYGDHRVVEDLSFEAPSGTLLSLLGPSGCGKTTVLNGIAGFLPLISGKILFDHREIQDLKTQSRNIGMVFQNYALYPHMTAFENIAFPLRVMGLTKGDIRRKVEEMAEMTQIGSILHRKPGQISGGQQQRVAISRALVKKPDLLLLDEPLSNLDAGLRIEMREEIRRIQRETGTTTLFVTHDQEEALSMSDRIVLLDRGTIQQQGTPQELYRSPANLFTARFFGNPPVNVLEGEGTGDGLRLGPTVLPVPVKFGQATTAVVRCEDLRICAEGGHFQGSVLSSEILGRDSLVKVSWEGGVLRLIVPSDRSPSPGENLALEVNLRELQLFDLETGKSLRADGP
ncbi:ABC transporter ATP-binding protein [Dethiosulfovibrio salsuginis]|uniref:Multiple sugar transport system ATP-binding protein n=1 Tax=Dethiosulfovibrio salsuginis TaxID=561720 RepID=A0A1X7LEA7_9BACT|nr:ABC transporter ATP-binding protein [Dethiosulfovibrio salsuginis]SMG52196.1 multiple sugar transport system ATP-binding protein [Dethiosulfovibrio salsuginis]